MIVVVGLGNPGEKYRYTRHNIGWLALDFWLGDVSWSTNKRFNALTYQTNTHLFIKPLSFMNESGQPVRKALDYYGLIPKNFGLLQKKNANFNDSLIVVHDELDLNFGTWKVSPDSQSAGHRGVQSIIDHLKTQKITRLRLGIKNDLLRTKIPADKFVLQTFNHDEIAALPKLFSELDINSLP